MKFGQPSSKTKTIKSIGLDLGLHTLKAVELTSTEAEVIVTNFAIREIPPPDLEEKDRLGAMGTLIKEMFAESGIKGKSVYISVRGHNVVIRRTALPKMPREEMIEAARWNAREEVLFPLENAAIDCFIMGETEREGVAFYDVLCVIVRSDIIPSIITWVEKAGLKVLGVTIIPLALWDYSQFIDPAQPGQSISYVDMSAERTRVYFISDNLLLFSREIPNGGKNVTAALAGKYETDKGTIIVDDLRAEVLKRTHGFPAEGAQGFTQEGISLQQIRERILPVVSKQMEEVNRSIEYFKNQHKKSKIDKLILSGGAASLSGLYKFLTENLAVEIERCNVLIQCKSAIPGVDEKKAKLVGASLTTAVGLALGRCEKINVLPEIYRTSLKKTLTKLAPFSVIPAVLLILLALSIQIRGKNKAMEARITAKEVEQAQLTKTVVVYKGPMQTLTDLKKARDVLQNTRGQYPSASISPVDSDAIFNLLSEAVEPNTSVSKLAYASAAEGGDNQKSGGENDILLQGNIFGTDDDTLESLTALLDKLNHSPVLAEAKLVVSETLQSDLYTRPGTRFEILLTPAMGGKKS